MGWLKKVVNTVRDVGRVALPGPSIIIDVAGGKRPVDAVRDVATAPVRVPVDAAAAAAGVVADIDAKLTQLEAELVQKIAGEKARKLFLDIRRVRQALGNEPDIQTQKQLIDSAQQFVNTLDPRHLIPLAALLAAELQRARDNFWAAAAPIPNAVVAAMPADLQGVARGGRHILVDNANSLSLPTFAISHFEKASAVAAIDLIFFKTIPGSATTADLHYWAHEITHLRQYRDLTLSGFAAKYVTEEVSKPVGGGSVNALEEEADRYACQHFHIPNPFYIGSCPNRVT